MIRKYLKSSLRYLWHNKLYASINVGGLAIGITCVLLAVLFVKDERSYDNFHLKKDLYRVTTTVTDDKGERKTVAGTGQPQGPAFKEAVPEIDAYVRILGGDIRTDVVANEKTLNLQTVFTDPNFFAMFNFPLLRGQSTTALTDITSVVITETIARKFFNSIDVVGKTISFDSEPSAQKIGKPMVIAGVAKDIPKNSSIRFDVLVPLRFMQLSFTDDNWLNHYLGTFVSLKPGSDISKVAQKFNKVFEIHASAQVAENIKAYNYDPKINFGLQAIEGMHLNPMPNGPGWREGGIVNESNPVFSYLFLGISAFILLMAGINFINISIAGSLKRAKEVGVRKIIGGSRSQIIGQFLFESAIVCVVAFALSLMLTNSSLPVFNALSGKELVISESFDWQLVSLFAVILLLIILLTGFYPAFVLSGFKSREVLYNRQRLSGRNLFGRVLVVVQFSLAVFFMISTFIYYRQMNFVRTKDLGYNPYQVIRTNINGSRDVAQVQERLRFELSREPGIEYLSFGGEREAEAVKFDNKSIEAQYQVIDEYRLPAMQIKLKAGRNISASHPSDEKHGALVNESFVKAAGLSSPIGTQIHTSDYYDKEVRTIVGVVQDYHTGSLHQPIKPVVMIVSKWYSSGIWIRVKKDRQQASLKAIEAAYKKVMPGALFQYNFLDDLNEKEYLQEQRWQKIILVATTLSIFICCLGLFGLAHLAAQQRVKEIGIRKVLGASISSIVSLLSRDFLLLVFIAFIVASPIAWYAMHNWLQDFAYRISISGWIFGCAGAIAILIALLTVSVQAMNAAVANPVKSLRTE